MTISKTLGAWISTVLGLAGGVSAHPDVEHRIEAFTARIEESQSDARAWLQRAACFAEKGDWEKAEADFARVKQMAPGSTDADRVRGECLLDAGRNAEAETSLDDAVLGNPADTRALELRARARSRLGKHRAAADDLGTALRHSADESVELRQLHARECAAANTPAGLAEALHSLDEGIAKLPPRPSLPLRLLAAELAAKAGRVSESLQRLKDAAPCFDGPFAFHQRKADILRDANRREDAAAAYAMALKKIESLPAERRATRMMAEAEAEIRKNLAALKRKGGP